MRYGGREDDERRERKEGRERGIWKERRGGWREVGIWEERRIRKKEVLDKEERNNEDREGKIKTRTFKGGRRGDKIFLMIFSNVKKNKAIANFELRRSSRAESPSSEWRVSLSPKQDPPISKVD